MATITIEIPDELALRLDPLQNHLPELPSAKSLTRTALATPRGN